MSSVVPLRSSSCQSPDLVLSRPFPSVLTTKAFDHSRRRWFGTCSCQPVPRGRPSSIKQLHTLGPPRPFALVAHCHPHSGGGRQFQREGKLCAEVTARGSPTRRNPSAARDERGAGLRPAISYVGTTHIIPAAGPGEPVRSESRPPRHVSGDRAGYLCEQSRLPIMLHDRDSSTCRRLGHHRKRQRRDGTARNQPSLDQRIRCSFRKTLVSVCSEAYSVP